jgi:hypothetical protein
MPVGGLGEWLKDSEMTGKPFEYDPELMEKARWIVERGLHRPPTPEQQLELPLPKPTPGPKKMN